MDTFLAESAKLWQKCQPKLTFLRNQGVFTLNEIQPVIEIRTEIILYWRIKFWCIWVRHPIILINRPKLIIRVPTRTGKIGSHFPVRKKSGK